MGTTVSYGVDQQNAATAYALTRKTEFLTVIENYFIENIGKIFLDYKPRSTNYNPGTGFSLVSGADKVMTSLIKVNSDKVTRVFGLDELVQPHDYGGSLATGHPLWVDDMRFSAIMRRCCSIRLKWVPTIRISDQINVGAEVGEEVNILMGSFIWAGEGDNM